MEPCAKCGKDADVARRLVVEDGHGDIVDAWTICAACQPEFETQLQALNLLDD